MVKEKSQLQDAPKLKLREETSRQLYVLSLPLCRSNSRLPNLSNPASLAGVEPPRRTPLPRRDVLLGPPRVSPPGSCRSLRTQMSLDKHFILSCDDG